MFTTFPVSYTHLVTVSEPIFAFKIKPTPTPMPTPASAARTAVFHDRLEIRSIRFNHPLIPVKALFLKPFPAACAVVVQIDIHKAIALGHFVGRAADNIDRSPRAVSEHVDAVADRFLDCLETVSYTHLDVYKRQVPTHVASSEFSSCWTLIEKSCSH